MESTPDIHVKNNSEPFKESSEPVLRGDQIQDAIEEKERLERNLSAPPHIAAQLQDRGSQMKQLKTVEAFLEKQSPRPYETHEKDAVVAREGQLLDEILQGMPTQAEMRKNPPGAVDKNRRWERLNKEKVLEWKRIRRRMLATGMIQDVLADSKDVANIEVHRPAGGSAELPMDNAQITGKQYHIPENVTISNVMTDADRDRIRAETIDNLKALVDHNPEDSIAIAILAGLGVDYKGNTEESKGTTEDGD